MQQQAFAEALRLVMDRDGLTQQSVAESVGTTQATVSRWLKGRQLPERPTWASLATLLGRPTEEVAAMMVEETADERARRVDHELAELRARVDALTGEVERLLDRLSTLG